jgi:hypothetical protein
MGMDRVGVVRGIGIAGAIALGCGGGSSSSTGTGSGTGIDGSTTASETGNGSTETGAETDGGTEDPILSVSISPADVTVTVPLGGPASAVQYTATAVTQSGLAVPFEGVWTFDSPAVATIGSSDGRLNPTAMVGGSGTVRVELDGRAATTSATVKLEVTVDPENVDPAIIGSFPNATVPDPTLDWLYPYDRTVFPRGLAGPVWQWNGGADTDIYAWVVDSPTFQMSAYGTAPNPSRWSFPTLPQDVWLAMTQSIEGTATVRMQRHDGTTPYLPITRTWDITRADLTGMIYYWEVNNGTVVRLPVGADTPEQFIQLPPTGNFDGQPVTCIACHSVSRDGSTIAASFNGSESPWASYNTDGTMIYDSGQPSGFQAISPEGDFVLWGQSNAFDSLPADNYLALSTKDESAVLAQLLMPTGSPVHPAWSNDGTKVAFGVRTDGTWLDFTTSTLWVADVDTVTPGFSNLTELATGVAPYSTLTFPTFTPDSEKVAYMRANQARTREGLGDLWMVHADGMNDVRLDAANGIGVIPTAEQLQNFEPTFMPVAVGGYNWLVFVSERQYGNTLTDQNPTTRFKQLWVSAVDLEAPTSSDPSHPAFWLPGQELDNQNMRGYWALNPCLADGEGCDAGFDCCTGFCVDDAAGAGTCGVGTGTCSELGDACATDGDCCDEGVACIGGFCSALIP